MNLQHLIRVAVCAAIVTLSVAGAGWFPAQLVVGQQTKPVTLRGAAALEQLKQDGHYDSLQTALNQARFSVSRAENTPLGHGAWRAPNPTAGYNAFVSEAGVSIAVNDKSQVSLSLRSVGYGRVLRAVGPGEVSGDKQTINLTRAGGVREWYVNGPDGLEQNFTLTAAPGARQAGVPLRLALQVSEGWRAVANDDGQLVTLHGAGGQAVQYSKLAVYDNLGRKIPARLTVAEEQVVIEVEDSQAAYPLTIDPTFTLKQKLIAADGDTDDRFGKALALSGDTVVIGAFLDEAEHLSQGSVYVFVRSGGAWTEQQKLTASDGQTGDNFGLSVAIDGDTLLVGAQLDDIGTNLNQGSVYIFTRSGAVWAQQQKITASDGAAYDYFGNAVAISGDTLAVGAYGDDIGLNDEQGSVYVFARSGTVWLEKQKLTGGFGAKYDCFGEEVALSGDTLAVGTPYDDIGAFNAGAVYVFARSGGLWIEQQYLRGVGGVVNQFFGEEVALSGDTLAVGAYGDNIGPNTTQGSVYVYKRSGTDWMYQQRVTANDGAAYDRFGYSVALSGDTLVVGANFDDVGANMDQGSAYVFMRSGASWTQNQKLTAGDGTAHEYFANAVAVSGDTVMVGLDFDAIGANTYQGSVYVFGPQLAFLPQPLPEGMNGVPYDVTLTGTGGSAPYQFGLVGTLPQGLSLATDGTLSGTPTEEGTFEFRIMISDDNGVSLVSEARMTILKSNIDPCSTIMIEPRSLPDGMVKKEYSEQMIAMGGTEPYIFTVQGTLPAGLSLSTEGLLSGAPREVGVFYFSVQVTDATGCTPAFEYRLRIDKLNN